MITPAQIQVHETGEERCKVLVVDDLLPDARPLVDLAARLAPFPQASGTVYPGQRRYIGEADQEAAAYVGFICRALSPVLAQVYGTQTFSVANASFSLTTRRAGEVSPFVRVPHYDGIDQKAFAILHYLSEPSQGGTAFYRHRRTGFECISQSRAQGFQDGRARDIAEFGEMDDYIDDSTDAFERIFAVEGRFNRVLIYSGAMLHSGRIAGCSFSSDPRLGRLTGNIFIRVDQADLGPYMAD